MANLDPAVASVLDARAGDDEQDEEELFAALEDDERDPNLSHLREQRLQQLHEEMSRAKSRRNEGFGTYREVMDEKELMDLTTATKWAVVHFFKPDFYRCGVMDAHLEGLASKHLDTRFVRINVENAPFLVARLKVKVLPCVLAFVEGVSADRIIGFEGLGHGGDSFTSRDLEARLLRAGVLQRTKLVGDPSLQRQRASQPADDDSDDD